MVQIISKVRHDYAGRPRAAGVKYIADPVHAKFLVKRGLASYAPEVKKADPLVQAKALVSIPAEPSPPEEPKSRYYKRRDLLAE